MTRKAPPAVPIECRDRLYALFVRCLNGGLSSDDLLAGARALETRPDWRAYVQVRIFRLERALLACQMMASELDPFSRDLRIGAVLFNEGLFFECHEYLEGAWRRSVGVDKLMIQGLIQAAAGFHKLELGSSRGAVELLEKAAGKLAASSEPRWAFAKPFAASIEQAKSQLVAGRYDARRAPKLELS